MKKPSSVEEYIERNGKYSAPLQELRNLICATELKETIKWSFPVYTLNGKNVLGLGAFKNHFGLWFFNGALLKDEAKLLINAQQGKTKAMRQMKFKSASEINKSLVVNYINEAIENQKLGKIVKPKSSKNMSVDIPTELVNAFEESSKLKLAFEKLTPYKKREYADFISEAKRPATKESRLKKISPMILKGIGLNDKYKNY